ncbi:HupA family protein [Stenotrophomonas pigmentata]|uniref:hypothetical protein n=1 Tax=Stenotrophomonas pigmentata TaxID=3055080 RepID=UPI0026EE4B3C|nr:hypothetical protein [Stenotrophomonas sp. 610A2]
MKMHKRLSQIAVALTVVSLAGTAAAANIVGAQSAGSGASTITVGESQVPFGPHTAGKAGVGISSYAAGIKVDFQGLTPSSAATELHPGTDKGMTVYQLHDPITTGTPGDPNNPAHAGLGSFNFVKVGTGDVWFGEWSTNGNTGSPTYQNRQVYYVGDKTGYTAATGTAVGYTLTGLHRYGANTHLTGSLTANFSSRTFHGDLSIGATQIRLGTSGSQIAFDTNGHFDAANAGQWVIPGNFVLKTGDVKGDFFGAQAATVAGIVDFGDQSMNIAWGGTKN